MEPTTTFDLASVVRRHQVGVWRYLRSLGCTADRADDLLQETFLVAFRRRIEDRGPAPMRRYLRRTARHLWLQHLRQIGRRREEALADAVDTLWERDAEEDDGDEVLAALRGCVAALGDKARAAVNGAYAEGLSRDELAARLGMKANGVKTLLQRSRAALRECVERRLG